MVVPENSWELPWVVMPTHGNSWEFLPKPTKNHGFLMDLRPIFTFPPKMLQQSSYFMLKTLIKPYVFDIPAREARRKAFRVFYDKTLIKPYVFYTIRGRPMVILRKSWPSGRIRGRLMVILRNPGQGYQIQWRLMVFISKHWKPLGSQGFGARSAPLFFQFWGTYFHKTLKMLRKWRFRRAKRAGSFQFWGTKLHKNLGNP